MLETLYQCDPEKNTECKKSGCALVRARGRRAGECHMTKNEEYAARDEQGKPVVCYTVMRGE